MVLTISAAQKSGVIDAIVTASHCIMGLLFVAAGVVQINDPDPLVWILAYWGGAAAVFTTAVVPKKEISKHVLVFSGVLPAFLLGFSLLGLFRELKKAWIVPPVERGLSFPTFLRRFIEIEEAREALGMLFLCLYLAVAHGTCAKATASQDKSPAEDPVNVDVDCESKLERREPPNQFPSYLTAVIAGAVAVGYAISWIGWKTALSSDAVTVGDHCKGIL